MKTSRYINIILILTALLVTACTAQNNTNTNTPTNTPTNNQVASNTPNTPVNTPAPVQMHGPKMFSDIYDFSALKNYAYQMNISTNGENIIELMNVSISSDNVNGEDAWVDDTIIQSQTMNSEVKTWLDKNTYSCIKIESATMINGQSYNYSANCTGQGPAATSTPQNNANNNQNNTTNNTLTYVTTETVTVGAGTFTADKYQTGDYSYWISVSPKVPLPLKITTPNLDMELMSYS